MNGERGKKGGCAIGVGMGDGLDSGMNARDASGASASHASKPNASNLNACNLNAPSLDVSTLDAPALNALALDAPMFHMPILHIPNHHILSNRKLTLACFAIITMLLVAIVVVGRIVEPAAMDTDFAMKNLPPSPQHPFGTDWMGRDMLLRTLAGLSTSVLVGLLAAAASSVVALVLGTVAAVGGKRADAVVTWMIDLLMGIPHIVLLILISYALGKGFWGVTIGIALTHWANLARVVRAEVLQCKHSAFVMAARRLGATWMQIAWRHMVPYVLPQFLVGLVLLFPHAILHEAAITFLGFGLPPEQPAIGIILSESMRYLTSGMWWLAVFPGAALVVTVLLFDLAGGSLRKMIDPHSSQE